MKKWTAMGLVLMMLLGVAGALAGAVDPAAWKTMADVLALDLEYDLSAWGDGQFEYIFGCQDRHYYVQAALTPEAEEALDDLDYEDADAGKKLVEILSPLPITAVQDMTSFALTDAAMDQLVGMKGQELLDAGWKYFGYYEKEDNSVIFDLLLGNFEYMVEVEETVTAEDPSFDGKTVFPNLTVKSVTLDSLSYVIFDPDWEEEAEDDEDDSQLSLLEALLAMFEEEKTEKHDADPAVTELVQKIQALIAQGANGETVDENLVEELMDQLLDVMVADEYQ